MLAVFSLMNRVWAICRLVRPAATRASTSSSRRVSPSERAADGAAASVAPAAPAGGSSRTRPRLASFSSSRRSGAAPSRTAVAWAAHRVRSTSARGALAARSASASRQRAQAAG
jgi:hypothetical protein